MDLKTSQTSQPIILCIDDDPQITETIQVRLQDYEVDVRTAGHGMHGYYEAMAEKPDLIITDIRMPQGMGDYVIECLRNNTERREVPVIVLSGQRDQQLKKRLQQLGVEAFISKPAHFEQLRKAIEKYIPLHKRDSVPIAS